MPRRDFAGADSEHRTGLRPGSRSIPLHYPSSIGSVVVAFEVHKSSVVEDKSIKLIIYKQNKQINN